MIQKPYLLISLIVSFFLLLSCNSSETEQENDRNKQLSELTSLLDMEDWEPKGELIDEFTFETITTDPIDIEVFGDNIIPWISLENPEPYLDSLVDADEVVVKSENVILVIDYPVAAPIEIDLKADTPAGFTRKELIVKISAEYHRIYREEEETSNIEVEPMEERTIMNRNTTDGKYGIWGHDLGDLDLSGIGVYQDGDRVLLYLYVES